MGRPAVDPRNLGQRGGSRPSTGSTGSVDADPIRSVVHAVDSDLELSGPFSGNAVATWPNSMGLGDGVIAL